MNMYSVTVQALLLCLINVTHISGAPVDCAEPENLTARFEELNTGINITQFYFPPSISENLHNESEAVSTYINERQQLYGDYDGTGCPSSLPSTGNYPIEIRSLCPWYYRSVHDAAYFPATIPEAVSRCKSSCVGDSDDNNVCELIYQKISVLKKVGCVEGLYRYVEVQKDIPVGAVCARRREIESSNSSDDLSFKK